MKIAKHPSNRHTLPTETVQLYIKISIYFKEHWNMSILMLFNTEALIHFETVQVVLGFQNIFQCLFQEQASLRTFWSM